MAKTTKSESINVGGVYPAGQTGEIPAVQAPEITPQGQSVPTVIDKVESPEAVTKEQTQAKEVANKRTVEDILRDVVPFDRVLVDKKEFYKLAWSIVTGKNQDALAHQRRLMICRILGAKDRNEVEQKWQEIKDYVNAR